MHTDGNLEVWGRLNHPLLRTAVVGLLALAGSTMVACNAGGPPSSEEAADITPAQAAVTMSPWWWSLGAGNVRLSFDVNTDLACGADPDTPNLVKCFLPDDRQGHAGQTTTVVTNWNSSGGRDPIPGGSVKSVAILKRTDQPHPAGSAYYQIYVLGDDNVVRATAGRSDHFYESGNFQGYWTFRAPTASDGSTLAIRKIVWMNEDGLENPAVGAPRLWAITYDNKAYFTRFSDSAWQLYETGVADIGHMPDRGATFLYTDHRIYYDSFATGVWSGWLPQYPSANIVAVGGIYALTDYGAGGPCGTDNFGNDIYTFCTGDELRLLRFNWMAFKWETYWVALNTVDPRLVTNYYPMEVPDPCTDCSPQLGQSIVDSHGFGSDQHFSFDTGPFVGWTYGQRALYYNPGGTMPEPFHTCSPFDTNCDQEMYCKHQPNGTPCGDGGVCTANSCSNCGIEGSRCCAGNTCPSTPDGVCSYDGYTNQCFQNFKHGKVDTQDWGWTWDWESGYRKATCPNRYGLVGVSTDVTSGAADAALCRHSDNFLGNGDDRPGIVLAVPGDKRRAFRTLNGNIDWDPNFWKLECAYNEMITGYDHTLGNTFHGVLCGSRAGSPGGTCRVVPVGGGDHDFSSAGEWDYWFHKAACSDAEFLAGISVSTQTQQAHALLCCPL